MSNPPDPWDEDLYREDAEPEDDGECPHSTGLDDGFYDPYPDDAR